MPGQVHVPEGGPSTSGRNERNEQDEYISEELQFRNFLQNNKFRVTADSGVPHEKKVRAHTIRNDLLYEKDGQFLPLQIFTSVSAEHYTFGRVENGYIRAIYNQNHKMVIIDDRNDSLHEMTPEEAAEVGINSSIYERYEPKSPPRAPGPSGPPGPYGPPEHSRGRRRNQKRKN